MNEPSALESWAARRTAARRQGQRAESLRAGFPQHTVDRIKECVSTPGGQSHNQYRSSVKALPACIILLAGYLLLLAGSIMAVAGLLQAHPVQHQLASVSSADLDSVLESLSSSNEEGVRLGTGSWSGAGRSYHAVDNASSYLLYRLDQIMFGDLLLTLAWVVQRQDASSVTNARFAMHKTTNAAARAENSIARQIASLDSMIEALSSLHLSISTDIAEDYTVEITGRRGVIGRTVDEATEAIQAHEQKVRLRKQIHAYNQTVTTHKNSLEAGAVGLHRLRQRLAQIDVCICLTWGGSEAGGHPSRDTEGCNASDIEAVLHEYSAQGKWERHRTALDGGQKPSIGLRLASTIASWWKGDTYFMECHTRNHPDRTNATNACEGIALLSTSPGK